MTDRRGTEHAVTEREGAGTIVRHRLAEGDGLTVTQEARLLEVVADHVPLPVPAVLRAWPDRQAMEMTRVPGVPLLEWLDGGPAPSPELVDTWATQLGRLQSALAGIPDALVADLVPRDATTPAEYLSEIEPDQEVLDALPMPARPGVERFLAQRPPAGARRLRLCHGDLGAEHVFVDPASGRITGVIDWSDTAITDPALDVGLLLRDLGRRACDRAVEQLGAVDDPVLRDRAIFYARARALEDLGFGIEHDLAVYRRNALRAIERLFAPSTFD